MPYEFRTKESEAAHGLRPQGEEVLETRLKGREQSQRELWECGLEREREEAPGCEQPLPW